MNKAPVTTVTLDGDTVRVIAPGPQLTVVVRTPDARNDDVAVLVNGRWYEPRD